MSKVTEALRSARLSANLTQRQVACEMGISGAYLNDLEHGRRDLPLWRIKTIPPAMRPVVAAAAISERYEEIAKLEELR